MSRVLFGDVKKAPHLAWGVAVWGLLSSGSAGGSECVAVRLDSPFDVQGSGGRRHRTGELGDSLKSRNYRRRVGRADLV